MKRHSYSNHFVIFPDSWVEREWSETKGYRIDPSVVADKLRLALRKARDERDMQAFFEDYPQALPELQFYHNGPRGGLVISKLPLGQDFICDFAYASENSQCVQFTCVEIESPTKRLFNKDGSFTSDYCHARQQIADWNTWGQQNLRLVCGAFDRIGDLAYPKTYTVRLECILIMGRRSELNTIKRKQRWSAENALRQASMHVMTYDRLIDELENGFRVWTQRMLVCHYADRALQVKQISKLAT